MDLAKIRRKNIATESVPTSLESAESSTSVVKKPEFASALKQVLTSNENKHESNQVLESFFTVENTCIQGEGHIAPTSVSFHDPIDIILAGRIAAGCCEDEQQVLEHEVDQAEPDDYLEFLCFKVADEIYGINIMDIKEIIKPREVTEVPRSPSFVSGIISLRGTIIPIIDMLLRLGLQRESLTGKERVVVIKNKDSFAGLLVDEVIQVVRILKVSIEAAPAILEGIDRDFVNGIGRSERRMIILLNLESIADIHLF